MNTVTNKIMIRVDGHKRIGMGHLYRMLTLSKFLRRQFGFEVVFVVRNNQAALNLIEKNHFRVYALRFTISYQDELEKLEQLIATEKPCIFIVDLRKRCHDRSYMKKLKSAGKVRVVAFTDIHEKSVVEADIVFNFSIYQRKDFYDHIKRTKYYVGFDYLILPPKYLTLKSCLKRGDHVEKVIICMGGSDHHNLTFNVLKAIDKSKHDFRCDVILSSSFFPKKKVDDFVKKLRHNITVYYDLDGIFDSLLKADLAITAGGSTHVECMCIGVPGIVINQLSHQAAHSRKIAELGAILDLGLYKNVNSKCILEKFSTLYEDRDMRKRMSIRGRELVDGKGLDRVSKIIVEERQRLFLLNQQN